MRNILGKNGIPYICTPLTGRNKDELMNELGIILPKKPDVIEWRADFLEKLRDKKEVLSILKQIKEISGLPVLFTIRSQKEGGQAISLNEEEKVSLLAEVCRAGADLIDYEVSNEADYIRELRQISEEWGTGLVLSYHNFNSTPSQEDILQKLFQARFFGADIAKAAVMPQTREDVIRLLDATAAADRTLDIPVVTMSMGILGMPSRMMGWLYGSAMTFAVGSESSAPGQIPIESLRQAIRIAKGENAN